MKQARVIERDFELSRKRSLERRAKARRSQGLKSFYLGWCFGFTTAAIISSIAFYVF